MQAIFRLPFRCFLGAALASVACSRLIDVDDYNFTATTSLGALSGACDNIGEQRSCSVGEGVACVGGTQTCLGEGAWSTCVCSDETGNGGSGNPDEQLPLPSLGCSGDVTQPCGPDSDAGRCEFGEQRCEGGIWGACQGGVYPAPRDCTSQDDDDCDGLPDDTIDDVCACSIGSAEPCGGNPDFDGRGPCRAGQRVCVAADGNGASAWGACEEAVGPAPEDSCDVLGNDANCSGIPNDTCPCVDGDSQPCGPSTDAGVCELGVSTCANQRYGECVGATLPGRRNCASSADNDCDGSPDDSIDNVCTCIIGDFRACGTHPGFDGIGRCSAGRQDCVGGVDNVTSRFEPCAGSIGPAARDSCDVDGDDSNCNRIPNEDCCPYCEGNELKDCAANGAPDPTLQSCALACDAELRDCSRPRVLSLGDQFSCLVLPEGQLKCWGFGSLGQLGYGMSVVSVTSPASVGFVDVGGPVVSVDGGWDYTCAALEDGSARCWGNPRGGRLGYPSMQQVGDNETPARAGLVDVGGRVVQISAGSDHTCAVLESGGVKCWGNASDGRLGYPGRTAVGVTESPASLSVIDIGAPVVQVGTSLSHTCALTSTGDVYCWGTAGFVGYGDDENVGDNETPRQKGPVDLGGTAVALAVGDTHTCVILTNGELRCWGANSGQLGYGHTNFVGGTETPAQAGPVSVGGQVVNVAAGLNHTCAVLSSGAMRCWGSASLLGTGTGSTETVGDNELPSSVPPLDMGGPVRSVSLSRIHSCAVMETGAVRCWGGGSFGAHGYGHQDHIGDNETPASVGDVSLF